MHSEVEDSLNILSLSGFNGFFYMVYLLRGRSFPFSHNQIVPFLQSTAWLVNAAKAYTVVIFSFYRSYLDSQPLGCKDKHVHTHTIFISMHLAQYILLSELN